jgi:sulfite oxidase
MALTRYSSDVFNAAPDEQHIPSTLITPTNQFFVRCHGNIPQLAPDHAFGVSGLVERELSLTVAQLQRNFPVHHLTLTIQCAGNRRHELNALQPIRDELQWGGNAVSTAEWTGVLLRDVLAYAQWQTTAQYVEFLGCDVTTRENKETVFGASIPLEKALADDVLIAWAMNGETLTPEHGYPLRVMVGNYYGARSVKWLTHLRLLDRPSQNFFQQRSYKIFASDVTPQTADWSQGKALDIMPVNSFITSHHAQHALNTPEQVLCGYAVSGMGSIAHVEVSLDDGDTWQTATLSTAPQDGCWVWWQLPVTLAHGENRLCVRATDSHGNTQPASCDSVWNFKGYGNHAWHRVCVTVV